jgi:hypothetical protein
MLRRFAPLFAFLAAILMTTPVQAAEDESPATIGLGFRSIEAPIGARWWITSMFGVDAGFGFSSEQATTLDFNTTENVTATLLGWTVDVGAPVILKQWTRVHCIARPGFTYHVEDDAETFFLGIGAVGERTAWSAGLDLEVELFLVSNVSLSASYGIVYQRETLKLDDDGDGTFDSEEDITNVLNSRGGNLTELGIHVYLW